MEGITSILSRGTVCCHVAAIGLPTNILTSCRNEIMANIDTWRGIVESKKFVELFGRPGEGTWIHLRGLDWKV